MIVLKDELLIAQGGQREVYLHPEDKSICIKVERSKLGKHDFNNELEIEVFKDFSLKYIRPKFRAMPNFLGSIETNKGLGLKFEVIRDSDTGLPSKTLFHRMSEEQLFVAPAVLSRALKKFRRDLTIGGILCRDLTPWNICAQKISKDEVRLVLVDGIGHRKYRSYSYFTCLIKMYIYLNFRKKYLTSLDELSRYCKQPNREFSWKKGPASV